MLDVSLNLMIEAAMRIAIVVPSVVVEIDDSNGPTPGPISGRTFDFVTLRLFVNTPTNFFRGFALLHMP